MSHVDERLHEHLPIEVSLNFFHIFLLTKQVLHREIVMQFLDMSLDDYCV